MDVARTVVILVGAAVLEISGDALISTDPNLAWRPYPHGDEQVSLASA